MPAEGVVKQALHGPKGATRCSQMTASSVFLPVKQGLSSLLKAGAHIAVKDSIINHHSQEYSHTQKGR